MIARFPLPFVRYAAHSYCVYGPKVAVIHYPSGFVKMVNHYTDDEYFRRVLSSNLTRALS